MNLSREPRGCGVGFARCLTRSLGGFVRLFGVQIDQDREGSQYEPSANSQYDVDQPSQIADLVYDLSDQSPIGNSYKPQDHDPDHN